MRQTKLYIVLALSVLLILSVGVFAGREVVDAGARRYAVTVEDASHAAVTASESALAEGRTLKVTVLPEVGYRVSFVCTEQDGKVLPMTEAEEHVYRTVMPAGDVRVKATILPESEFGVLAACDDDGTAVQAEPASGCPGQEVCVTVQPPEGKRIQSVEAVPETMNLRTVRGSGAYYFTMPESDVYLTIYTGERVFSDVEDSWYEPYVYKAVDCGYLSGVTEDAFEPDSPVTRAQAAQALYAMAGYPAVTVDERYADITPDLWYAGSVIWASGNKILSGNTDGTFRPEEPITRQQIVTAIHKFAIGVLGEDTAERSNLSQYSDRDRISSYASASVKWAVSRGILSGLTQDTLDPTGAVPRSQLAVMLLALGGEKPSSQVISEPAPEVTATAVPAETLDDVNENSWYYDGVNYTVSNGYMTPVRETEFMPKALVTRQHAARILYALDGKPAVSGSVTYGDLTGEEAYADAVLWATQRGFVTGYFDGTFRPDAVITRQQFIAMLYKYAFYKGYDLSGTATLDAFEDGASVEPYAQEPMRWAAENRIVQGSRGILGPTEQLTRAQMACMIHTFGICRDPASAG